MARVDPDSTKILPGSKTCEFRDLERGGGQGLLRPGRRWHNQHRYHLSEVRIKQFYTHIKIW